MAVAGARNETVARAAAATDMAVRFFEDKLSMKVSPTKTVVIGSRLSLAKRAARAAQRPRAAAVKVGKLLGAAAAGGTRRATCFQKARMAMFAKKAARIRSLGRGAGVDARRLTGSTAAPTMLYGAECIGVADTVLDGMRRLTAQSAAAMGGGKNADLVLLAADCDQGTMDPCFAAHTLPIGQWAKAVWEGWAPAYQLTEMIKFAKRRRALMPKGVWAAVTGPAAALLTTLERLGWMARSASAMVDDQGRVHDMHVDPPAVIIEQVRASVRRWRLARVAHACPGLVPDQADHGTGFEVPVGMYPSGIAMLPRDAIDMSGQLRKLLNAKSNGSTVGTKGTASAMTWLPEHRAALRSAATAGQWPQCKLKQAFQEVEDGRCQLCLAAQGDLAHRYVCATTMPQAGWPIPPGPVAEALSRMAPSRRRWLTWRGLYVARVRVPAARVDAHMEWIIPIPDAHLPGAKWIIDGSLLDGPRRLTRRPGFALLMVSQLGTPLALGLGTPPEWIHTANGAEGWALLQVLLQSTGQETIYTDCKSLLDSLRMGPTLATAAGRSMARLWSMIFHQLDDAGSRLRLQDEGGLVWMPAHTAQSKIGIVHMSDGAVVSAVQWRGNRLVDIAAKKAAACHTVDKDVMRAIDTAEQIAWFGAAGLGIVTHAANNHRIEVMQPDGTVSHSVVRDSAPIPLKDRAAKVGHAPIQKRGRPSSAPPRGRCTPSLAASAAAKRKRHAQAAEDRSEVAFWSHWQGPSRSSRESELPSATARLDALRRRIKDRMP
jgi:hypothetical protein